MTCRYCNGTGKIALLTSVVECDCVKTPPAGALCDPSGGEIAPAKGENDGKGEDLGIDWVSAVTWKVNGGGFGPLIDRFDESKPILS